MNTERGEIEKMEEEEEEEEEERREAVNHGSNPCNNNRSNPKSSSVTQDQLSKFQELQRRRLKLISKPKNKNNFKAKGAKTKLRIEELDKKGTQDEKSDQELKDHSISISSSGSSSAQGNDSAGILSSSTQVDVHPVFRKKKLHWGLDSKERWERKANM